MYKSPIEIFTTDIQTQIMKQQEEEIYKAIVNVGINVDKEELLRALQYDRWQYEKGYADGKADAMAELVRCKDCEECAESSFGYFCDKHIAYIGNPNVDGCTFGKEKEDGERRTDGNQT